MRIDVLDHGYVEFVERWGSDEHIIEAARMSTNKGFKGWGEICKECGGFGTGPDRIDMTVDGPDGVVQDQCDSCDGKGGTVGDEKLLAYLWNNKHATPFEMAGLVIEVQAPIFVFREWHRHRTQSYSELSARYTPIPDFNYVPTIERILFNSSEKTKQAGTVNGAEQLTEASAIQFQFSLRELYVKQQGIYEAALQAGVPKELARIHLPVARYSRMRASANLRNWLGFLTLRMDKNAQWEIRQFANAVARMIEQQFPRTWDLYNA
jgi:thymidylate synthase (FAD)